jgi:hypothetical protein
VVEPCENLSLGAKAAEKLGRRGRIRPDQLDRDLVLELPVIPLREVDGSHAAPAELPDQPIGPNTFVHSGTRRCQRDCRFRLDRLAEKVVAGIQGMEAPLDFGAQAFLSCTRLVQKARTGVRIEIGSRKKDLL